MHDLGLAIGIGIGIGQKDRVAMVIAGVFDPVYYLTHKRVSYRRDHHANRLRPLSDQPAGDRADAVAGLFCDVLNLLRGIAAN